MTATDDIARRERARKYLDSVTEWPSGSSGGWTMSDVLDAYHAGAREEAARAAEKLREAASKTRTPFGEVLLTLADEIEEGA